MEKRMKLETKWKNKGREAGNRKRKEETKKKER